VSLDDGLTWKLADIQRFEKPNAYGEARAAPAASKRTQGLDTAWWAGAASRHVLPGRQAGGRALVRATGSPGAPPLPLRHSRPRAGKHWCWVHWSLELPVAAFLSAKELLCRAWDETMNTQPAAITWNVMGMMNNCYFR
jgi:hypothetical protein